MGKPDPGGILEASNRAVSAGLARFKDSKPQIHVLGHSLGSACALQLAAKLAAGGYPAGRLVLSAPFLSIPHVLVHWLLEYASKRTSRCGRVAGCLFTSCGHVLLLE